MAHKDAKSPRKTRAGKQQTMMAPLAALQYLASRKKKPDLYRLDSKKESRYGFSIGEFRFLLRARERVEIIEAAPPCPIPNTPPWFAGMINLRGNLLPVFDLKQLLNMHNPEPSEWIMIFGQGSRAAGVYADSLPSAVIPERATMDTQTELPEILQDCVENTLMQGDSVWLEVAFEKIFVNLRAGF